MPEAAVPVESEPSQPLLEQAFALVERDPEQALALLDSLAALNPDPSQRAMASYVRGRALQTLGRHRDALNAFQEAQSNLREEFKGPGFYLNQAVSWNALLDPQRALEAITHAEQAPQQFPAESSERGLLLLHKGIALTGVGQAKLALEALRAAVTLVPRGAAVRSCWLQIGLALNALGEFEEAVKALDSAIAEAPPESAEHGILLLQKGIALLGAGQPKLALEVLRPAVTLVPGGVARSNCSLQIGAGLNALGQFEEAAKALDRAIAEAPPGAAAAHLRILAQSQKAIAWSQMRDAQKALEAVEAALHELRETHSAGLPPGFETTLLVSKANVLTLLQRNEEVPALLEEAQRASPALGIDVQFWVLKVNAYFLAGRFKEALAEAPAEIAGHPLVLAIGGSILSATGDWEGGRQRLRSATTASRLGNDALAWTGVGLAELALYHWKAAIDAFERARGLSPLVAGDPNVSTALGMSFSALERYQEAWELVKDLPDTDDTLLVKAITLQGLGQSPQALQTLERVSSPGPATPPQSALSYWLLKGGLLLASDRSEESLTAFETASTLAEQPANAPLRGAAAVGRASALIKLKRSNDALELLAKFTAKPPVPDSPRPGAAWWLMGGVLAEKEHFEEALRAVTRAQSLEPENGDFLISKGKTLFNLEDYKAAEAAFKQALGLARTDADRFEALIGQGNALNSLELYEAAIEVFRQALSIAPDTLRADHRLWVGLGESYRSLGRYQAALRTFQEGWRLDAGPKKSSNLALGVAAMLIEQKRDGEAVDFLREAQQKAEPEPGIDLNLGIALYRLKQSAAAQQAWRRAASAGSQQATEYLEDMPKAAPDPGDLMGYWFGAAAPLWRRITGGLVAFLIAIAAILPIISKNALIGLRWLNTGDDYKMGWITLVAFLLIFLAPVLKSISLDVGPVKLEAATPEVTSKPNMDALLEKLQAGASIAVGPQSAPGQGVRPQSAAVGAVAITSAVYRA
jgi:tetratricopeptide (TPR) repeat protein